MSTFKEAQDADMWNYIDALKLREERAIYAEAARIAHRTYPVFNEEGAAMAEVREFESGATRDLDTNKHDPEGFLHPLVIERFNEYMHANRLQKDGNLRDSDNWQKGIPTFAYMKSMWRHFHDVWLHHRGYGYKAKEPLQLALCGLLFNVQGMLLEVLKKEDANLVAQKGRAVAEAYGRLGASTSPTHIP